MIEIDPKKRRMTIRDGEHVESFTLEDPRAFEMLSSLWMRSAWETKYLYTFTWFGRPIIQLPDDMFRVQEVLYAQRPDVVIETGVAHGGSLVFYASIFEAMGSGRVIGVDIEIRPHNRKAIEEHPLFSRIELIEGNAIADSVVADVRKRLRPNDRVIVFLDSNHSYDHVLAELEAYAPLVSVGSYIVATDGIMKDLVGSPRSQADWGTNNPFHAAQTFLAGHPEFVLAEPSRTFDESDGANVNVTQWPGSWLKRVR